ncbi:SH3 domain-containing protein [Novosphingobium sp. SL115]|uniref:SH3 domain-containing protein n=1 Tax=Novosphingobium sp. SL115 TaxID=2995150 RepID=UPI002272DEF4|nr:SH3 domain-containing protein [Novosphingobium sp. SL115]MCY1671463.1 SH3 domain-containing protein [Novosphingobium sp. SL115]
MTIGVARRFAISIAAVAAVALGHVGPVSAQTSDDAGVPYWVSTSKDKANMRVGPGREYRINWTYVRKGVPLKVLRMMGGWRLVEDPEGARGWILAQFLTRQRAAIVKGGETALKEGKDGGGRLLWRVAPGVIGKLGDCEANWCAFDVDGRAGFIRADSVWGAGQP